MGESDYFYYGSIDYFCCVNFLSTAKNNPICNLGVDTLVDMESDNMNKEDIVNYFILWAMENCPSWFDEYDGRDIWFDEHGEDYAEMDSGEFLVNCRETWFVSGSFVWLNTDRGYKYWDRKNDEWSKELNKIETYNGAVV